jgi:hypothetical protein
MSLFSAVQVIVAPKSDSDGVKSSVEKVLLPSGDWCILALRSRSDPRYQCISANGCDPLD